MSRQSARIFGGSARPLPAAASVVVTQLSGAWITVVRSIVDLGHHLGCPVTAGGIEDRAALDYLVGVGGDHAQIYFIARRMRSDALDRVIDENMWLCCREANA